MSRRKQSNPKPLKREDFWNEGDAENATAAHQSPAAGEALSGGEEADDGVKIEVDDDESNKGEEEEEEAGANKEATSHTPKLKLNANLATDPALRNSKDQQDTSSDRSSPAEEQRFKSDINILPTIFPGGASPAPAIFCLPAVPDANGSATATNLTTPRLKQENLESPTPPPPPRQANCFMCQPCGIKFSSISTLEAHQTYYCSHRAAAAPRSTSPTTTNPGTGKEGSDNELGSPRSSVAPDDDSAPPPAKVARMGRQYTCPHCSYSADKKVSLNRHMRMHTPSVTPVSPAPTAPSDSDAAEESSVSSSQLPPPSLDRYCANCDIRFSSVKTFRAHKAHYCDTRHVVKPNAAVSPAAASQASSGPEQSRVSSAASPTSSPAPAQPYMALPTNPMLLVPYQLVQAASFVSSAALPPGINTTNPGACLLLVNGTVQPLVLPAAPERVPSPTPPPPPPRRTHQVEKQPSHAVSTPQVPEMATNGSPFPLDLSLPRSGHSTAALSTGSASPRLGAPDPEDEKENRGLNTSSPSQDSSRASSPLAASPRPARVNGVLPGAPKKQESAMADPGSSPARKTPNLVPHIKLPKQLLMPELLAPLLGSQLALLQRPLLSAAEAAAFLPAMNHVVPPPAPQILVKQGVSRCEECNIVFLKVENFEVHKKYYCSARTRSEESTSPVEVKSASTPSPTPPQTAPTPPGKIMQQYICAPCGIKFTSIHNLKAHQTYYCLKRDVTQQPTNNNDPPPERKKCPKCKVLLPGEEGSPHQCQVAVSPPVTSLLSSNGWRCPCCTAHLPTATAAQKHLEENHSGMLKGFRCTICSYRGNTLRGMRTHIRMHLLQAGADNKTCAEVKEEDFITCVLQNEPEKGASSPPLVQEEQPRPPRHRDQEKSNGSVSPEALVVKLEPCEEKISLTEEKMESGDEENKHCKACDISFHFREVYLSHKRFYCKAAKVRMASASPPSPAVRSPPTPAGRPEASART